jgi:hypothetical protein
MNLFSENKRKGIREGLKLERSNSRISPSLITDNNTL